MKFLTYAALIGAVVSAQDNIFMDEETETPTWIAQNKKALAIECGRIKIRLTQAYQYARVVTGLTDTQKGVPSIQQANTALNSCTYDNIAYKCPEVAKDTLFLKLKLARQDLGNVARMNTDENLEHAYNSVFWAYEYSMRCVNPKAYYETLVDVTVAPDAHQTMQAGVGLLKNTLDRHAQQGQGAQVVDAFHKLDGTPEYQAMVKQGEIMSKSTEFAQTHAKVDATAEKIKSAVHTQHSATNKETLHVDNAEIPALRKEVRQTKKAVRQLKRGEQGKALRAKVQNVLKTESAANVKKAVIAYKNGDGQELKKQIQEIKMAMKGKLQVSDLPPRFAKRHGIKN